MARVDQEAHQTRQEEDFEDDEVGEATEKRSADLPSRKQIELNGPLLPEEERFQQLRGVSLGSFCRSLLPDC